MGYLEESCLKLLARHLIVSELRGIYSSESAQNEDIKTLEAALRDVREAALEEAVEAAENHADECCDYTDGNCKYPITRDIRSLKEKKP